MPHDINFESELAIDMSCQVDSTTYLFLVIKFRTRTMWPSILYR